MKNQLKNMVAICAIFIVLLVGLMGCLQDVLIEDTIAPANVTELTAIAGNTGIKLSWINPTDSDFNGVEVSMNPAAGSLIDSVKLGKSVSSLLVSRLTENVEYTFIVKSIDTSSNYSVGETQTATIIISNDKTAPGEVSELTATAVNGKAILTWGIPTDSDFNGVEVSVSPAAGTLANPVILGKTVNTLSVGGLTNGTEYVFTVKSIDTSLNYSTGVTKAITVVVSSNTSNTSSIIDVTNLDVINKDSAVLLTWTDATDEDIYGYEVSWDKEGIINRSIEAVAINTIVVAQGSGGCYISNLVNGTKYTFTVKTINSLGSKSAGVSKEITPSAISTSDAKLSIELSIPSPEVITKDDVTVTVGIFSTDVIKKVVYQYGIVLDSNALLTNGTEISVNNGVYSFVATKSGTYSVTAIDTVGRQEISYLTISNIDKEAPSKVICFDAVYSYDNKSIDVTWLNPKDNDNNIEADFDHLILSYKVAGTTVKTENFNDKRENYEIPVPEGNLDGVEYAIEVVSVDALGNISDSQIINLRTSSDAVLLSVSLNRERICVYNTKNIVIPIGNEIPMPRVNSITALIKGMNFNKLETSEKVIVSIYGEDSGTLYSTETITDFTNPNEYLMLVKIPENAEGHSTVEGTNYLLSVELNGHNSKTVTTSFNVAAAPVITSSSLDIETISINEVINNSITSVSVEGTNLDIPEITIYLFDIYDQQYGDHIIVNQDGWVFNTTSFTQDISIPTVSGVYSLRVCFNGVEKIRKTLQVYDNPEITSFYIPKAGISKSGKAVKAVIKGSNFTSPNFDIENLLIECDDIIWIGEPEVLSDIKIILPIRIPDIAGTYEVTVNGITEDFEVKDYGSYAIGDVILKDGTKVDVADVSSIEDEYEQIEDAVAVIAAFNDNGAAICVGLKNQDNLPWTPYESSSYYTLFPEIVGSYIYDESVIEFSGDVDGSDNWQEVCLLDSVGTKDPETNYPAFNYANTYAQTLGLTGTDYEDGWYLPSSKELYFVMDNLGTINTSLTHVGEIIYSYNSYWTSTQESSSDPSIICISKDSADSCPSVYCGTRLNHTSITVIRIF